MKQALTSNTSLNSYRMRKVSALLLMLWGGINNTSFLTNASASGKADWRKKKKHHAILRTDMEIQSDTFDTVLFLNQPQRGLHYMDTFLPLDRQSIDGWFDWINMIARGALSWFNSDKW